MSRRGWRDSRLTASERSSSESGARPPRSTLPVRTIMSKVRGIPASRARVQSSKAGRGSSTCGGEREDTDPFRKMSGSFPGRSPMREGRARCIASVSPDFLGIHLLRVTGRGRFFSSRTSDCTRCPLKGDCLPKTRINKEVVIPHDYPALIRARRRHARWSEDDRRLYRRHLWRFARLAWWRWRPAAVRSIGHAACRSSVTRIPTRSSTGSRATPFGSLMAAMVAGGPARLKRRYREIASRLTALARVPGANHCSDSLPDPWIRLTRHRRCIWLSHRYGHWPASCRSV